MKKFVFGFLGLIIVFILSAVLFGGYHSALSAVLAYLAGIAVKTALDNYTAVG